MFLYSAFSHLADVAGKLNSFFEAKRAQIISSRALLEGGWLDLLNGQRRQILPFASFACDVMEAIARVNQGMRPRGFDLLIRADSLPVHSLGEKRLALRRK